MPATLLGRHIPRADGYKEVHFSVPEQTPVYTNISGKVVYVGQTSHYGVLGFEGVGLISEPGRLTVAYSLGPGSRIAVSAGSDVAEGPIIAHVSDVANRNCGPGNLALTLLQAGEALVSVPARLTLEMFQSLRAVGPGKRPIASQGPLIVREGTEGR